MNAVLHTSHIDDFVEEGIVTSTEKQRAYVMVPEKGDCEDCSAKIFCSSNSAKMAERTVFVRDRFGVSEGDTVRFAIHGGAVIMAGVFMYGVPLLLLIAGIFGGMELFSTSDLPELYSTLATIGLLTAYFAILYMTGLRSPHMQALPDITHVVAKAQNYGSGGGV